MINFTKWLLVCNHNLIILISSFRRHSRQPDSSSSSRPLVSTPLAATRSNRALSRSEHTHIDAQSSCSLIRMCLLLNHWPRVCSFFNQPATSTAPYDIGTCFSSSLPHSLSACISSSLPVSACVSACVIVSVWVNEAFVVSGLWAVFRVEFHSKQRMGLAGVQDPFWKTLEEATHTHTHTRTHIHTQAEHMHHCYLCMLIHITQDITLCSSFQSYNRLTSCKIVIFFIFIAMSRINLVGPRVY